MSLYTALGQPGGGPSRYPSWSSSITWWEQDKTVHKFIRSWHTKIILLLFLCLQMACAPDSISHTWAHQSSTHHWLGRTSFVELPKNHIANMPNYNLKQRHTCYLKRWPFQRNHSFRILRHIILSIINISGHSKICNLFMIRKRLLSPFSAHLASFFIIHQNVPCSKVPVYKFLLGQVLHTFGNLMTEPQQLLR